MNTAATILQGSKDTTVLSTNQLRVLVIHGNPLFRLGLHSILEGHGMQVAGESVEREEILTQVAATKPDVVLVDAALEFHNGYGALSATQMVAHMRAAGARGIFVLEAKPSEESLYQFLRAGAAAYERATLSVERLLQTTRRLAQGEYCISEEVLIDEHARRSEEARLSEEPYAEPVEQELPALVTEREVEILQAVMIGMTNKQIGRRLRISDQTVKNHITAILRKLSVRDRTAAVVKALNLGIVTLTDFQSLRDQLAQGFVLERMPSQPCETALSTREIEVLRCVMRGWTHNKIGRVLKLSTKMVQTHMASVKTKLGVQGRTEAVLKARHLGILAEEHQEEVAI
jgi:DNA-binding NarL/FixJ family response regulator